jgi:sugar phosphate isomerase/epimerase
MMTSPLALQLYTVRDQMSAGRKGVLQRIADLGYGAVEPFDVVTDPDGLRAELDAAGLEACSAHGKPSVKQAAAVFRGARTVGAGTVIVPSAPAAIFADREMVAALARKLNEMAVRAADEGLRLGYHNHEFELASILDGRTALEVLADSLDSSVVLEIDTYWAAVAGQDVAALLGRLGDRVRYLHIKDGPVTRYDPMTAVGAGGMPTAEILAACPSAEWRVVELDWCGTDVFEAVRDSMTWLSARGLAQPVRAVSNL